MAQSDALGADDHGLFRPFDRARSPAGAPLAVFGVGRYQQRSAYVHADHEGYCDGTRVLREEDEHRRIVDYGSLSIIQTDRASSGEDREY